MINWLANKLLKSGYFDKFITEKIVDAIYEFAKTETMNNIISDIVVKTLEGNCEFGHHWFNNNKRNPLVNKIVDRTKGCVHEQTISTISSITENEKFIDDIVDRIKRKQLKL